MTSKKVCQALLYELGIFFSKILYALIDVLFSYFLECECESAFRIQAYVFIEQSNKNRYKADRERMLETTYLVYEI